VDLSSLRFWKDRDAERYFQLRRMIHGLTDSVDWMHMPLHIAGNFVGEYWTLGPDNEHIKHGVGQGWKENPGVRWYELEVMSYDLPDVFGLKVKAGCNPHESGWGVDFSYINMGLMGGISTNLVFVRWEGRRITDRMRLGTYYYRFTDSIMLVGEDGDGEVTESDRIEFTEEVDVEKELISLFMNPRSFRRTALDRFRKLQRTVEKAFHSHSVKKQIFEEYKNDGIPPEYTFSDLDVREEEDYIAAARTTINGWISEIKDNYSELYDRILELAPFHEVWK